MVYHKCNWIPDRKEKENGGRGKRAYLKKSWPKFFIYMINVNLKIQDAQQILSRITAKETHIGPLSQTNENQRLKKNCEGRYRKEGTLYARKQWY